MKQISLLNQIKKITAFTLAGFTIIMLATSCSKDSGSGSSSAVSTDEAAEAVTQAVTPESGGMVEQVDNSVAITAGYTSPCGLSFDSSITATNTSGSIITYSFNLAWHWIFVCSPQKFDFDFKGSSVYDAPRMSSNDSSKGIMTITGIENSSPDYVVNTSYIRNGSQQSKVFNKNSFSSLINITSENINIDKTSQEIVSGTGTFDISGAATNGTSFSYHGTITFNGNKTATLVFDNGNTYNISW